MRYYKGPLSELIVMSPDRIAETEAEEHATARAARERRERLRYGPTARIRGLTRVGDSEILPTVKDSSRASTLARKVALDTGGRYSCRTERCPIYGDVLGVRVTRTA